VCGSFADIQAFSWPPWPNNGVVAVRLSWRAAPTGGHGEMADLENENGQDRSLDPTDKRLEDARAEGQVARSRDLGHFFIVGASVAVLALNGSSLAKASENILRLGLRFDADSLIDPARMTDRLGAMTLDALMALAPVFGVMLVATVAAPLLVGGWIFVPKVVQPDLQRLDPVSGLGRLFSWRSVVGLGKNALLSILLAVVGASFVLNHVSEFASLASGLLDDALAHFFSLILSAFGLMVVALATMAAIDVPYQVMQFRKKLKMTLQEVRDESREMQGDPRVKQKVRRAQREMARRRMMAAVPNADVVVTNPTHFAVALKYLEDRHRAPVVVAKGSDEVAARIRELAAENGVPLLEAPPLARALHKHVDIGGEIPAPLYTAVAQVLAYVFQLRKFESGEAPRPAQPTDLPVPEGFDPFDAKVYS
jgi:flagellar biosynthetic protein FlhB